MYKRQDLGHVINENKKPILITAFVVVLAIVAYAIIGQIQSDKKLVKLDRAYEIEKEVFDAYIKDEIKADQFLKSFYALDMEMIGHPNLVPVLIESINKLAESDLVTNELIETVQKWQKHIKKSNFLNLFLSVRLAALYEDEKKYDQAITLLESLVGNKSNILKDKIYYDLGRLYLAKDDKKTANERFNKLIEENKSGAQNEYVTLAKIYLSEI